MKTHFCYFPLLQRCVMVVLWCALWIPSVRADAPKTPFDMMPPNYTPQIVAIEKIDVFRAGEADYYHFRIPGLVVTNRGTLLVYSEARRAFGDWSRLDVALKRSEDGGRSWGPIQDVSAPVREAMREAGEGREEGKANSFNNPTAVVDRATGAIHLIFCSNYERLFLTRSDDDGRTFSPPVEITSVLAGLPADVSHKIFSPGPGHGIQLQSGPHAGRLLFSLRLSDGSGRNGTRPCWVSTLFSDDGGQNWQTGSIVTSDFTGQPNVLNPMEGALAELSDGRVMMNIRNEAPIARRLVATSPDGATDWTTPVIDPELVEPVSFGSLAQLTDAAGKPVLLFVNPVSLQLKEPGRASSVRQNLTVRLSLDNGVSWPQQRVIEPGLAGYVDINAGAGQMIFCAYERGTLKPGRDKGNDPLAITLASFHLKWLAQP